MRVHVNGRLPLIKQSVIEYPNGDEVSATFVYERIEKHCSVCNRLDHEVRDCLEAKHQKKVLAAAQEEGSKTQRALTNFPPRLKPGLSNEQSHR